MKEIIFEKSRKNLKKAYNRIKRTTVGKMVGREEVLFLAMGGYNRTYELLIEMGLKTEDIVTFSNLNLSHTFLQQTHNKKVVYIRKINYITNVNKTNYSARTLDLNVADSFEESMMIYKTANRKIVIDRQQVEWIKPTLVILDDQSLNLQFGGHRFYYQSEIGFVQVRNRNVDPKILMNEIKDIPEAEKMMFALYQKNSADEAEILEALHELRIAGHREEKGEWYYKPTEYKKIVGSNDLAEALKEEPELKITQLKSNKRLKGENARWVIVPEEAFEFKGFDYKDEEDIFEEEIQKEKESELEFEEQQEKMLNEMLSVEFTINLKAGYIGRGMQKQPKTNLQDFLDTAEEMKDAIKLLEDATTEKEYEQIKRNNLVYFLDGNFKDNERDDDHYQNGKMLVVLDVDDKEYEREELEEKLEENGYFGLVYPTARYYHNGSKRWRMILLADEEMNKESYREVSEGIVKMLELDVDSASSKISQLMGYPFKRSDVSIIVGTKVNVRQFKKTKEEKQNTISFTEFRSNKSLLEFNHRQSELLKEAYYTGISKGRRNDTYRQIVMYLRDTLENDQMKQWHNEANQILHKELDDLMSRDGLGEKERQLIMR